jgi:hypothetical protein
MESVPQIAGWILGRMIASRLSLMAMVALFGFSGCLVPHIKQSPATGDITAPSEDRNAIECSGNTDCAVVGAWQAATLMAIKGTSSNPEGNVADGIILNCHFKEQKIEMIYACPKAIILVTQQGSEKAEKLVLRGEKMVIPGLVKDRLYDLNIDSQYGTSTRHTALVGVKAGQVLNLVFDL